MNEYDYHIYLNGFEDFHEKSVNQKTCDHPIFIFSLIKEIIPNSKFLVPLKIALALWVTGFGARELNRVKMLNLPQPPPVAVDASMTTQTRLNYRPVASLPFAGMSVSHTMGQTGATDTSAGGSGLENLPSVQDQDQEIQRGLSGSTKDATSEVKEAARTLKSLRLHPRKRAAESSPKISPEEVGLEARLKAAGVSLPGVVECQAVMPEPTEQRPSAQIDNSAAFQPSRKETGDTGNVSVRRSEKAASRGQLQANPDLLETVAHPMGAAPALVREQVRKFGPSAEQLQAFHSQVTETQPKIQFEQQPLSKTTVANTSAGAVPTALDGVAPPFSHFPQTVAPQQQRQSTQGRFSLLQQTPLALSPTEELGLQIIMKLLLQGHQQPNIQQQQNDLPQGVLAASAQQVTEHQVKSPQQEVQQQTLTEQQALLQQRLAAEHQKLIEQKLAAQQWFEAQKKEIAQNWQQLAVEKLAAVEFSKHLAAEQQKLIGQKLAAQQWFEAQKKEIAETWQQLANDHQAAAQNWQQFAVEKLAAVEFSKHLAAEQQKLIEQKLAFRQHEINKQAVQGATAQDCSAPQQGVQPALLVETAHREIDTRQLISQIAAPEAIVEGSFTLEQGGQRQQRAQLFTQPPQQMRAQSDFRSDQSRPNSPLAGLPGPSQETPIIPSPVLPGFTPSSGGGGLGPVNTGAVGLFDLDVPGFPKHPEIPKGAGFQDFGSSDNLGSTPNLGTQSVPVNPVNPGSQNPICPSPPNPEIPSCLPQSSGPNPLLSGRPFPEIPLDIVNKFK